MSNNTRRVLVTRRLLPGGLDPLLQLGDRVTIVQRDDDTPFSATELRAAAADVDAIICVLTDRIDETLLTSTAPPRGRLQIVSSVSVGYDHIDVAAARRHRVVVANTPGVLTDATADTAFALILAACRRTSDWERVLRDGHWGMWRIDDFLGIDAHGATLGLVGYGRIARAVARRAAGFDMRVLHWTRTRTGEPGEVATLDELLEVSDIVSLHVPLSEQTRHLIGGRELERMRSTAVLVNTSRGPVVDEEALAIALETGQIFAAGIDVYEREPTVHPRLLAAPHTVLYPHIGSATTATRTKMAQLAAANVASFFTSGSPLHAVG